MSTLRVVEDLRRKKNRQRPSRRKTRKNALIQEPDTSLSSYLDQPDVISEILSSTMPINAQTREDFPSIPLRYSNSASSFPRPLNAINDDQFHDDNNNYYSNSISPTTINNNNNNNNETSPSTNSPPPAIASISLSDMIAEKKVPVFSTISKDMKKKVARLPDPNEFEQKVLDRIQKEYIDGEIDLSLNSPSLYKGLKKGAQIARRRSLFAKRRPFLKKTSHVKEKQPSLTKQIKPSSSSLQPPPKSTISSLPKSAVSTLVSGTSESIYSSGSSSGSITNRSDSTNISESIGDRTIRSGTNIEINKKKEIHVDTLTKLQDDDENVKDLNDDNNTKVDNADKKNEKQVKNVTEPPRTATSSTTPPKTASSTRIFEKIDTIQEEPEYGEDYRKDRFALPPPEIPVHDVLVKNRIEDEMIDLNQKLEEAALRQQQSIETIEKDVRKKARKLLHYQEVHHIQSKIQYQHAVQKVEAIDDTIEKKMQEARDSLPADFMFKRGLGAFVMARGAEVIFKVFKRFTNQILHSGIEHWQQYIEMHRKAEKIRAAIEIQKIVRGSLARNDLKLRKAEKIIQDEREQDRLARLYKKRYDAAKLIQAHVRGNIGRKIVAKMKKRLSSVYVIQRFIRMTQAKFFLLAKRAMWEKRKKSATAIQACWRGCKGRYRAKIVRKIRRAEKYVEYEKEKHENLQEIFKQEGAAVSIQLWWTMVRLRHEFLRLRKLMKRRRVMVLQRSYRCYRARCELARRREAKRLEDIRIDKAAKLVQAAFHRKQAYKKVRQLINDQEQKKKEHDEYLMHQKDEKKIHLVGGVDLNLTKMRRRMFKARKLLNPFESKREEKAALKIQAAFRGMKSRKRLREVRKQHHLDYRRELKHKRLEASKTIQRFWRGLVGRRLFLKARRVRMAIRVQARFRGWKGRQIALEVGIRWYAAIRIQALFRGFVQRSHFTEYCRHQTLVKTSAIRIQKYIRGFTCRQKYGEKLERERYLAEIRMRGRTELEACAIIARDKLLLKASKAKAKFDGATQALFQILTGLSKSKDGVAPKSFLKLAKETKMIDDKRIKLNTCDLAVSKAKGISKANGTGTGAGNLTHAELVYALQYLANKKYPKLESLRRHEGDDARFNKFCYEFIFTNGRGNAKEKKQALKRLPTYLRPLVAKMNDIQNAYLGKYARKIQGHMRGEFGRNLFEVQKRRILQERERNKMIRASLMISKRQRILKARKVVGSMAAKIIQKFVDPLTGDMYYYNPRTKQRSYDKPEILGKQDVEKPFILPDKHYEFVVNCASCKRKVATVLCDPCGDAYCDDCFKSLHSKGNKSKHHKDAIPMCSFCDYQACTRFDRFHKQWCDSCYEHVYEDTAQAKTFTWNILPCSECEERACKWRCLECDDCYCTKCFGKVHRTGNRALHRNVPLAYYTVKMENQKLAMEREAKRKIAAAEAAKRMAVDDKMKLEFIARKLQAIWRGRKGRADGKKYLKQERKKMRVLYKKTKEDNKTRKTMSYGLKSLIGVEEILETDDAETRARKERSLLRDPNKAMKHFQEHAFEFQIKGEEGKLLPFKVNCYHLEVEFETLGDLRDHLKPGDYIRIGYADHTINMDTEERNYTHQFMCLDRPWANADLLDANIYKMRPPARKIGLSAEIGSLAADATKGIRGVLAETRGSLIKRVSKKIGGANKMFKSKLLDKAANYYDAVSQREMSKSLQEERTPGAFEKERRYWTENYDEWGTPSWYNRITDETVSEKPECLLNKEEMKEFKAKEAIRIAKEEELKAQKRELEWKKKQRAKAKAGRGRGGRRR